MCTVQPIINSGLLRFLVRLAEFTYRLFELMESQESHELAIAQGKKRSLAVVRIEADLLEGRKG